MTTTKDLIAANGAGHSITQPATSDKRSNWSIEVATVPADAAAHKRTVAFQPGALTFTVKGCGTLTLDLAKVDLTNVVRAALHGFKQRIADAAAIPRDAKTGKSAPASEKFAAMQRLVDHYNSGAGEWSPARAEGTGGGGAAGATIALLVAALQRMRPDRTAEQLTEKVKAMSGAERAALLVDPSVKPHADAAREEIAKRMAGEVDTGKLLADL